jgi:Tol biopolymer transport system component
LIFLSDHSLHQYDLTTRKIHVDRRIRFLAGIGHRFVSLFDTGRKTLLFDGYDPLVGCSTFRRIYQCGETGPNGFFTYDLTNGAVNLIRPFTQSNISLSPDGTQLAFTVQEFETSDYQVHLKLSPVAGGEPTSLSGSHVVDSFPSWSPDGQWIAFYRSPSPDPDAAPCTPQPGLFDSCSDPLPSLYIVHPDGKGLSKLLEDVRLFYAPYNQPNWSSNSQTLAVISGSPQARISFVNLGDRSITTVEDLEPTSVPVWSPISRLVAFSIAGASPDDGYIVLYDVEQKSGNVAAGSTPVGHQMASVGLPGKSE